MISTHWVRPTLPGFLALAIFSTSTRAQNEDKSDKPVATKKIGKAKGKKKREGKAATVAKEQAPLTAADYGQWEKLGTRKLSPNGKWLACEIRQVDEERSLHLHHLKGKSKETSASYKYGERPVFSKDSAWFAVTIGKSPAELKKLKEAGDKAPAPAGKTMKLRRLSDGETRSLEHMGAFSFSADSRFAAMEIVPESESKSGKVLVVRNLDTGHDTTFGNVVQHAWSTEGALLAMAIDSPSISNALQVYNPADGKLRTLETSEEEYAELLWRKDAMDLAVMREMKHGEKEDVSHVLLAWRHLDRRKPLAFRYEHANEKLFPEKMYISSGGLNWSKDGKALYCELKEWEKRPEAEKTSPDTQEEENKEASDKKSVPKPEAKKKEDSRKKPSGKKDKKQAASSPKPAQKESAAKPLRETLEKDSNVEVWHSKDLEIMPQQKKNAAELKNPERSAVWWLDKGKLIQITNELTEKTSILRSGKHATGRDYTPHEQAAMFGPRLYDLYLIDTATGKRECIEEQLKYQLSSSPNGRHLLFLKGGHVWSHDVKSGKATNLTEHLETHFTNQEDDTLTEQKRPYANTVWLHDSSAFLLYDRFDIWKLTPDGSSAVKLTHGAEDMIRHRLSQASFHEDDEGAIHPKNHLFVALYGERTKKSGYARMRLDPKPGKGAKLERLLWEDRAISSLTRAEEANTYTFVKEASDVSPDLFVSNGNLRKVRKLTDTNSFQGDYHWGHSELVDFTNKNGVALQGMLTYPANYQEGKQYPMVVYIYEERSQNLHRYFVPSEKHPYNPTVYSAEGYFVFQPDIIYRPQEPGVSAVECVVPAVKEVIKTGMIDEDRIGLIGHSWGAYQTTFIVTQTDLFAAGIAGAPLTNMMSMAASVYWNSGQPNARIFSESQGRMDRPFWRHVDNYVRNSPIHGLDSLETPLLMAFGDKDGAVDWGQGVQMYNAARWAGKDDVVMLVYPGENHGLRKDENMVDYHYRVLEWFGHYLKEQEAPKWITEGKSYLDRQKELEEKKEKVDQKKKPAQSTDEANAADQKEAKPSKPNKKDNRRRRKKELEG